MRRIHHIGVAVQSLETALPFYQSVLGLKLTGTDVVPEFQVKTAFLEIGESRSTKAQGACEGEAPAALPLEGATLAPMIELLEPLSDASAIRKFLNKRGEGFHHIALEVDDVAAEIARLKKLGVEFLAAGPQQGAHGTRVIFIKPSSTLKQAGLPFHTAGLLVELVEEAT